MREVVAAHMVPGCRPGLPVEQQWQRSRLRGSGPHSCQAPDMAAAPYQLTRLDCRFAAGRESW